jgi:hypothetical protein
MSRIVHSYYISRDLLRAKHERETKQKQKSTGNIAPAPYARGYHWPTVRDKRMVEQ